MNNINDCAIQSFSFCCNYIHVLWFGKPHYYFCKPNAIHSSTVLNVASFNEASLMCIAGRTKLEYRALMVATLHFALPYHCFNVMNVMQCVHSSLGVFPPNPLPPRIDYPIEKY